jgi:hypothetical protein
LPGRRDREASPWALLVAATFLCAAQPAHSQSAGEPARQSLTVTLGVAHDTRRDAADSPLAYSGSGPLARIGYERTREGRRLHVSFTAGGSTLTPSGTVPDAFTPFQEAFTIYALEAGMDWRLRGSSPRRGDFALGVEFGSTVTLARHLYAGQDISQQSFDLGVVTLGPSARWTRRFGDGEVSASLAVPLLAWVDHPYADVRFATQLMKVHFAPFSRFHEADGELSYSFRPGDRYGIEASYRLELVELNELQVVRRASQSLTIAVVRRFGVRP